MPAVERVLLTRPMAPGRKARAVRKAMPVLKAQLVRKAQPVRRVRVIQAAIVQPVTAARAVRSGPLAAAAVLRASVQATK